MNLRLSLFWLALPFAFVWMVLGKLLAFFHFNITGKLLHWHRKLDKWMAEKIGD